MEWWVLGVVWLACAAGCLLVGQRQGKAGKVMAFGLLFGPAALAVVLSDDRRNPRPPSRGGRFVWVCLTTGQVVSALVCAASLLACGWVVVRLVGVPGPIARPAPAPTPAPQWVEDHALVAIAAGVVGFLYHAGLWLVFSHVKDQSRAGDLARRPGGSVGRHVAVVGCVAYPAEPAPSRSVATARGAEPTRHRIAC